MLSHVTDTDMEHVMIDTAIARAVGLGKDSHEQECSGLSKDGFTAKIHALADALCNPLKFVLTTGTRNEIAQTPSLT